MKKQISALLLLALAACSSSGGGSSPDTTVPQDIKAEPVVSKAALTPEQKSMIKGITSKGQLIPDSDVILFDVNNSDQGAKTRQEEKLARMSPAARTELSLINQNCLIIRPKAAKSGDQSMASGSQSKEDSLSSISGSSCPVSFQATDHKDIKVISSNGPSLQNDPDAFSKLELVEEMNESQDSAMRILDPDLAQRSDQSSSKSHMGAYSKFKFAHGGLEALYMQGNMTLSGGQTIERTELRATATVRASAYFNGRGEAQSKIYMKIDFVFPGLPVTVQIYGDSDEYKYFVNGEAISLREFSDIFGTQFDVSMPKVSRQN